VGVLIGVSARKGRFSIFTGFVYLSMTKNGDGRVVSVDGTGSSDMTWSAMIGLTRSFGWSDILFVYRHLEYDEDFDGLMQNFSFSGPAVSASFLF